MSSYLQGNHQTDTNTYKKFIFSHLNERLTKWKQMPGRTRPARPRRCLAFARETHSGLSVDKLDSTSKFVILILPQSTTYTTSSIVIDVSENTNPNIRIETFHTEFQ